MIDLTFKNINRFFLQLFEAGENDPKRNYSDKYYLQLVEINTLAEILLHLSIKKQYFHHHIKTKHEVHEKLVKMLRNNIIQQETCWIIHGIKIIINSLA